MRDSFFNSELTESRNIKIATNHSGGRQGPVGMIRHFLLIYIWKDVRPSIYAHSSIRLFWLLRMTLFTNWFEVRPICCNDVLIPIEGIFFKPAIGALTVVVSINID